MDQPTVEHHREDPFAVKLTRRHMQSARDIADYVNHGVDVRRRLREHT